MKVTTKEVLTWTYPAIITADFEAIYRIFNPYVPYDYRFFVDYICMIRDFCSKHDLEIEIPEQYSSTVRAIKAAGVSRIIEPMNPEYYQSINTFGSIKRSAFLSNFLFDYFRLDSLEFLPDIYNQYYVGKKTSEVEYNDVKGNADKLAFLDHFILHELCCKFKKIHPLMKSSDFIYTQLIACLLDETYNSFYLYTTDEILVNIAFHAGITGELSRNDIVSKLASLGERFFNQTYDKAVEAVKGKHANQHSYRKFPFIPVQLMKYRIASKKDVLLQNMSMITFIQLWRKRETSISLKEFVTRLGCNQDRFATTNEIPTFEDFIKNDVYISCVKEFFGLPQRVTSLIAYQELCRYNDREDFIAEATWKRNVKQSSIILRSTFRDSSAGDVSSLYSIEQCTEDLYWVVRKDGKQNYPVVFKMREMFKIHISTSEEDFERYFPQDPIVKFTRQEFFKYMSAVHCSYIVSYLSQSSTKFIEFLQAFCSRHKIQSLSENSNGRIRVGDCEPLFEDTVNSIATTFFGRGDALRTGSEVRVAFEALALTTETFRGLFRIEDGKVISNQFVFAPGYTDLFTIGFEYLNLKGLEQEAYLVYRSNIFNLLQSGNYPEHKTLRYFGHWIPNIMFQIYPEFQERFLLEPGSESDDTDQDPRFIINRSILEDYALDRGISIPMRVEGYKQTYLYIYASMLLRQKGSKEIAKIDGPTSSEFLTLNNSQFENLYNRLLNGREKYVITLKKAGQQVVLAYRPTVPFFQFVMTYMIVNELGGYVIDELCVEHSKFSYDRVSLFCELLYGFVENSFETNLHRLFKHVQNSYNGIAKEQEIFKESLFTNGFVKDVVSIYFTCVEGKISLETFEHYLGRIGICVKEAAKDFLLYPSTYQDICKRGPTPPINTQLLIEEHRKGRDSFNQFLRLYTDQEILKYFYPKGAKLVSNRSSLLEIAYNKCSNKKLRFRKNFGVCSNLSIFGKKITDEERDEYTFTYGTYLQSICLTPAELEMSVKESSERVVDGVVQESFISIPRLIYHKLTETIDTSQPLNQIESIYLKPKEFYKVYTKVRHYLDYEVRKMSDKEKAREIEEEYRPVIERLREFVDMKEMMTPYLQEMRSRASSLSVSDMRLLREFFYELFIYSMYLRRWRGPGFPYPIARMSTLVSMEQDDIDVIAGQQAMKVEQALRKVRESPGANGILTQLNMLECRSKVLREAIRTIGGMNFGRLTDLYFLSINHWENSSLPIGRDGALCIRMASASLCISAIVYSHVICDTIIDGVSFNQVEEIS